MTIVTVKQEKTLLDEFAMAALPVTAVDYTAHGFAPTVNPKEIAEYAYQIANAMMKERQKYEIPKEAPVSMKTMRGQLSMKQVADLVQEG